MQNEFIEIAGRILMAIVVSAAVIGAIIFLARIVLAAGGLI